MITNTATIRVEGDSWVDINNKFAAEVTKLYKEEEKLGGSWALVSDERRRVWLGCRLSDEGNQEQDYGFEYRVEAHYKYEE